MYGCEIVCLPRDRQRAVLVGVRALRRVDEEVPRDLAHRGEHARIANAARDDLRLDHPRAARRRPAAPGAGVTAAFRGSGAAAGRGQSRASDGRIARNVAERARAPLNGRLPDAVRAPPGDAAADERQHDGDRRESSRRGSVIGSAREDRQVRVEAGSDPAPPVLLERRLGGVRREERERLGAREPLLRAASRRRACPTRSCRVTAA